MTYDVLAAAAAATQGVFMVPPHLAGLARSGLYATLERLEYYEPESFLGYTNREIAETAVYLEEQLLAAKARTLKETGDLGDFVTLLINLYLDESQPLEITLALVSLITSNSRVLVDFDH